MIRIRQILIDVNEYTFDKLKDRICSRLKINDLDLTGFSISKQSIDARRKDKVYYVFEVDVSLENEEIILNRNKDKDIFLTPYEEYELCSHGDKVMKYRPVVVGSGPAGLFCAYMLLEAGFKPIVIERGKAIDERVKCVNDFWNGEALDLNTNVQFGEGGAGTFSDGKLNTLVKDKKFRMKKVFSTFCKYGALDEIMYMNGPHIGTDKLREIIKNMRIDMINRGATFKYESCLTDLVINDGKITGIVINNDYKLDCDTLVLCTGHSARDTFRMLYDRGVNMESKPFAVGVRVSHPQEMININQYGDYHKKLKPASYKLSYTASNGRGVYSFCMCPGGYVVDSSSFNEMLVVNGMSNYARESKNANSAIVVSVSSEDFGSGVFAGMEFQEKLERLSYSACGGKIPVSLYRDFVNNKKSISFGEVLPVIKGSYDFCNLNDILPSYICESLKEGISYFERKIPGFSRGDALLFGTETRTSSPVRIVRDDSFQSNIKGVYPCGEGAGYAGGITTSAMDGIKVAEAIISMYSL